MIKQTTLYGLRADTLSIVDMAKVTKEETPRMDVSISSMSADFAESRSRAMLEAERRFCGDKTKDITGFSVVINKMERGAMLLDLRTAGGAHVDKVKYVKSKEDLKATFIEYGMQCLTFE